MYFQSQRDFDLLCLYFVVPPFSSETLSIASIQCSRCTRCKKCIEIAYLNLYSDRLGLQYSERLYAEGGWLEGALCPCPGRLKWPRCLAVDFHLFTF